MDSYQIIATSLGVGTGLAGIGVSIGVALRQTAEARVSQLQLMNYLVELHAQMLSRFDRLDAALAELLARSGARGVRDV